MQQAGGSQFGVPSSEMTSFSAPSVAAASHMLGIPAVEAIQHNQLDLQVKQLSEAASPRGTMPGLALTTPRQQAANFDELAPAVAGNFPEDDALAGSGNRWPRQETLALLRIRSEMDATFRDATLKGPLWDEVSRKLAELGYKRNAKKCKEKFENVHKYYKRTKEGRAGRQDGKSYRFFSELEALHSNSITTVSTTVPVSAVSAGPVGFSSGKMQVSPISAVGNLPPNSGRIMPDISPQTITGLQAVAAAAAGISFSSNSSEDDDDESNDEDTDEGGEGRKRKRGEEDLKEAGTSKKMMAFFDGLMKQLMEKQELMQRQLLETIEKREQERMMKEEGWRRQEMARLSREQELLAQERAIAASRDAALISYLQKISNEKSIPLPALPVVSVAPSSEPAPTTPTPQTKPKQLPVVAVQPLQQQPPAERASELHELSVVAAANDLIGVSEQIEGGGSLGLETMSSSRWPKAEVHALIKIRSGYESKYQEAGPKGPLWEEISAEMQKIGYNRNAKRCKEKWENINKYFKKVKESNKKRPEDAKTCPYFHQLDALYRQKQLGLGGDVRQQESSSNPSAMSQAQAQQHPVESEGKKSNGNGVDSGTGGVKAEANNGGLAKNFYEPGLKKPEDIMKELMHNQPGVMDEDDSENMDQNYSEEDDEDEDDEESDKMQYKIQYQRPVSDNGGAAAATKTAE